MSEIIFKFHVTVDVDGAEYFAYEDILLIFYQIVSLHILECKGRNN